MYRIITRLLFEKKWFIIGWSCAISAMIFLMLLFFPSLSSSGIFSQLSDKVPAGFEGLIGSADSFNKIDKYIATQVYTIRIPMLFMIMGLVLASGISVTLERNRLLRGFLALRVSRARVFLSVWLVGVMAMLIASLIAVIATCIGLLLIGESLDEMLIARLALLSWIFGVASLTIPLAIGYATGKSAIMMSIGLIATIGSFILSSFAVSVSWLEPIERASLLHYYDAPRLISEGLDMTHIAVLLLIIFVSLIIGLLGFRRRDIS